MEESSFLQASLGSSHTFSDRSPREPAINSYYLKSMTQSTFQSALRQKASMESIRDSLSEEWVKVTKERNKLRSEVALLPSIKAELEALRVRHSAALELMGEQDEERGRSAEAEAEFAKLLGALHVKASMSELSKTDRGDEVDGVKLSELFYGRHFRVDLIGSALLALQQLSGINAVFYFSSMVFRSAGVPSDIANMSVGVVNLSGSIVAMILMDKLGRRGLLLGSFMGMALSMAMQAAAGSSSVAGSLAVYLSVGGVLL